VIVRVGAREGGLGEGGVASVRRPPYAANMCSLETANRSTN